MATKKITELVDATEVNTSDELPIVQAGTTKRATVAEVLSEAVQNTLSTSSTTVAPSVDSVVAALGEKVGYRAPLVLTDVDFTAGNLNLVASAYANRLVQVNTTSDVTVTVQTDSTGGSANDDSFTFMQMGVGKVTPIAGVGVTLPTSWGYVTATRRIGDLVSFLRIGADTWRPMLPESPVIMMRQVVNYVTPTDTNSNIAATFALPPLLPNSRVEVMASCAGSAGTGDKTMILRVNGDDVASNRSFTSTAVNGSIVWGFRNNGATNVQKATQSNNIVPPNFGTGSNGFLAGAVQTNVSTNLTVECQKTTAADVFTVEAVEVRVWL